MRTRLLAAFAGIVLSAGAACSIPQSDFKASDDGGTNADTSDALAFVVNPTTPLVITEGDHKDFTVALNHAPGGTVTVQLATTSTKVGVSTPTLTFDDSDFGTPKTVTIEALQDSDSLNENGITVEASANGIPTAQVQVQVTDDDVLAIVTDIATTTTTINVDEGGSVDVRVHLSAQPTADVTVTAILGLGPVTAEPMSRVFTPLDYDSDKVFSFSAAVDPNTVSEDVSLAFRAQGLSDKQYTVHVIDKDVLNIQTNASALTINEGTSKQVQVFLSQQPSSNVTVSLTTDNGAVTLDQSQLTFTPTNWGTAQFVTATAPQDVDTADGSDTIRLKSAGLADRAVSVTVKDDDVQKITTSATSVTVAENGQTSFNVSLAFKPAGTVTINVASLNGAVATATPGTLTFDPTTYATPQSVTVKGTDDTNLVTNTTTIRLSEASIGMVDLPTTVTDDDTQTIILSKTTSTITEPNSDTFTVKLGFDPGGTVSVNVASSDTTLLTIAPSSLTFDSTNYGTPKTVTMSAVDDADANDGDATVNVTGAGAAAAQVSVHVKDNDVLQLAVNASGTVQVNEGGFVDVSVHLTAKPNGSVTVTPQLGTGPITVSPASVAFSTSDYGTDKTFRFTAAQDANTANEDVPLTLHASIAGITDASLTLETIDDDVLGIKLNPTGTVTLTEEGAAQTLQISLSAQPAGTTTVNLTPSNGKVSLSTSAVQFTTGNWSSPQSVTITAPADLDTVNDTSVVTASAIGLSSQMLNVSIIDNDTQAIMTDAPSTLNVAEGGTTTFHVWLAFQPTATTTVNVASLNTNVATVSPGFYDFTPQDYATHKTVTVTGVEDQNLVTNSTTIRLSEATIGTKDTPANVTDNDVQSIILSKSSLSLTEGSSGTFTVKLAFDPGGTVNVSLSSSNATALPVTPATFQFTSMNYATAQTATVNAPTDSNTTSESATITVSGAGDPDDATLAASVADQTVVAQFGWPTPFTSSTNGASGIIIAYQIQVTSATNLDTIGMYSTSATGSYSLALYADSGGGHPSTLVAATAVINNVAAGNNVLDISPDKTLAPGTYWIALRTSDNAFIGQHPSALGTMCMGNYPAADPWPNNWVSLSSPSCQNLNLLNLWISTYHQ